MDRETDERFDSALKSFPEKLRSCLQALPCGVKRQAQEIRLRVGRPVSVCCCGGVSFLNGRGELTSFPDPGGPLVRREDLEESFRNFCGYSVYSHQAEIRNGYVALTGGHRAGICGTAVYRSGEVCGMRDISSVNVRIAREMIGCADGILDELKDGIDSGLLLVGAPASGKTTILRDISRQLASGRRGAMRKVTVVDERGELAGTYLGEPQNDLGVCCDVLDGYPKAEGILLAVRSLSPEFVICDELGTEREAAAVEQGLNAGVAMIASIHAGSRAELMKRRQAVRLLQTGAFGYAAVLEGRGRPGRVAGIYKAGDLLAEGGRGDPSHSGGDPCGIYGVA